MPTGHRSVIIGITFTITKKWVLSLVLTVERKKLRHKEAKSHKPRNDRVGIILV